MTPGLETPRLWLRPLAMGDAERIQAVFPRWEIVKYLASRVPWPYPHDGARRYVSEMALPAVERGEAWHWTIRLKAEPERLIGFISLMMSEEKNRGFWLDPAYWGRGLMSEACDAVTDYWFEVLKFPRLRAPKAIANEASRRISQKQGMRVIARGERDYVCGRLPSETWEITAAEWHARNQLRGKTRYCSSLPPGSS